MKYLKYFETYISGEAGYIVDFREIQRILKILGWEVEWRSDRPNRININLNLIKIPYSIFHLLLINNNITESYPIITRKPKSVGTIRDDLYKTHSSGLIYNTREISLNTNISEDKYDENGAPEQYSVNKEFGKLYNKSETTLTKSIEKLSIFIRTILYFGTRTKKDMIGNKKNLTKDLQNSIVEFLNEPNKIPEYLLNTIYDNISNNLNNFQIIKEIKEKQKFIYYELLKLYPNIETGNQMGELGF